MLSNNDLGDESLTLCPGFGRQPPVPTQTKELTRP